jgi:hypothetical protein
MNGLIFTPDRNTHGKKDYTGAFKPLAIKFAKHHGIPRKNIIPINVGRGMKKRKLEVIAALQDEEREGHGNYDTVAFFCHGFPQGIQAGFSWRGKQKPGPVMDELASLIYEASDRDDICVPLFCCSTANTKQKKAVGGDGGFADELRDALCRQGAIENRVVGHTTVGHTTTNPSTRFFDGSMMPAGGTGGYWIARPRGPLWPKWKKYLRGGGWMDMPYLELEQIRDKLK